MKSEKRSIKKVIKNRISVRQGKLPEKKIRKNKRTDMGVRDEKRRPVQKSGLPVGLVSRSDLRTGKNLMIEESKEILPIQKEKKPISIIVTAYQTQDFIEETLDSIENQTYFKDNDNFEVLVGVDGCQDTLNKLLEIRHKYRNLRILMMKRNAGTYFVTNTLLKQVKYENILRFDSDDIMKPHMINEIMAVSNQSDVVRVKCNDFKVENNNVIHTGYRRYAAGVIFYKKSVFDVFGGYRTWKCAADSELIQRIEKRIKIKKINKILFERRIHTKSLSNDNKTRVGSDLRVGYHKKIREDKNNTEVYVKIKTVKFKEIL